MIKNYGILFTGETMVQFHVMFLTKREQVTLRLLLFDLLSKHIRLNVDRLTDFITASSFGLDDPSNISKQSDYVYKITVNAVDLYERITETLPTINTISRANDMTWQIDVESMKHVVLAVNSYDKDNSVLSKDEHDFVSGNLTSVKKLVNQSKEFIYTEDDIMRIKKGK